MPECKGAEVEIRGSHAVVSPLLRGCQSVLKILSSLFVAHREKNLFLVPYPLFLSPTSEYQGRGMKHCCDPHMLAQSQLDRCTRSRRTFCDHAPVLYQSHCIHSPRTFQHSPIYHRRRNSQETAVYLGWGTGRHFVLGKLLLFVISMSSLN